MGGPGSGPRIHWWRGTKKATVEESVTIDVNWLVRQGLLAAGARGTGCLEWKYSSGRIVSIEYDLTAGDTTGAVRLSYMWSRGGGTPELTRYDVRLTTTRPRLGGLRWWLACPLTIGGQHCGRRVGKLYLPPGGRYFGCRHCHRLTYRSCQECHQHESLYRFIARGTGFDAATLKQAFKSIGERRS